MLENPTNLGFEVTDERNVSFFSLKFYDAFSLNTNIPYTQLVPMIV